MSRLEDAFHEQQISLPLAQLPLFGNFPPEVKLMIWKIAAHDAVIPGRLVDINMNEDGQLFTRCNLLPAAAMLQVSSDTRSITLYVISLLLLYCASIQVVMAP